METWMHGKCTTIKKLQMNIFLNETCYEHSSAVRYSPLYSMAPELTDLHFSFCQEFFFKLLESLLFYADPDVPHQVHVKKHVVDRPEP